MALEIVRIVLLLFHGYNVFLLDPPSLQYISH